MFPSGNVGSARITHFDPLTIEIKGNPDHSNDSFSRYWLFFRIKGYLKSTKINFILKDVNHLRKFYNCDKSFLRPSMVYKINDNWRDITSELSLKVITNIYSR